MPIGNAQFHSTTSLIIGVTGHRMLRQADVPALRAHVRSFFDNLQQRYPQLPLVLLSPLAAGSDQLVTQVALDMGIRVIAPLPVAAEFYRDDFDMPGSRVQFEQQLVHSDVLTMALPPEISEEQIAKHGAARDRQYAQTGIFVSSHCHMLLALWDGVDAGRLGGTAQIVKFHLHGEIPGEAVQPATSTIMLGLDEDTVVYHIPTYREGSEAGISRDPRWLTVNDEIRESVDLPDTFDQSLRKQADFNADVSRQIKPIAEHVPQQVSVDGCPIEPIFQAADSLARKYQRRVVGALRITYVLAAMMGLAFFAYTHIASQDAVIYVFLLVFIIGMSAMLLSRNGDWQRKYLDYRALAEGLRIQGYWRRAGIVDTSTPTFAHDNFLQKQDAGLGWIRNVMRGASLEGMLHPASPDVRNVDAVIQEWIGSQDQGGQLHYYSATAEQKARVQHRAEVFGWSCVALGVGISIVLAIFAKQFDTHLKHNLVAVMGIISVAAGVHEAYAHKKADKELIKQYRFMRSIFGSALRRLNGCTDVIEKRRVLRALGEAALTEHAEWTLMHRERPVQHSRI